MGRRLDDPIASVVIPYNGDPSVAYTLKSLAGQRLKPHTFEVIVVVEEGSCEDHVQCDNVPFILRKLYLRRNRSFRGHSAGPMRNLGARNASGAVLVFLDSDCIVHPECISKHLSLQSRRARTVACGAMHELAAERQPFLLQTPALPPFRTLKQAAIPDFRINHPCSNPWENLYSLNFSLPAKLFHQAGGFDETGFRCHDMELGYRLHRLNARIQYAPQCEVLHIEHPRLAASRIEQARGWRLLGERYPELKVVAEDRVLACLRDHSAILRACETRFSRITDRLPGYRVDNIFVVSPATDRVLLNSQLQGTPFVTTQYIGGRSLRLGLHRNCWDYSILVPDPLSLRRPSISVLMTTFNSAATTARAIGSVLVQTFQDFEIVLVDDSSSDETVAIVNRFSFDGRIRVFRRAENQGQSCCLNVALSAARARYVVQLDSDDWLEPKALEVILSEFRNNPRAVAVYGSPIIHDSLGNHQEKSRAVSTFEECLTFVPLQAPRAYVADKLRSVGGWSTNDFFDGRYFEDRLTLAKLARIGTVHYVREPIHNREVHPTSLSQSDPYLCSSGKLLILWQEANGVRKDLHYKWDGRFLSAELVSRKLQRPHKKWSIVIPAHDRQELLNYTLQSWLESDLQDAIGELIIVDDASTKPITFSDCHGTRIRIVRSDKRLGPAGARNLGAANANYEFLFFCDSDHIVPPDVLASHEARHRGSSKPCLLVGGLFGAKVATHLNPSEMDAKLLEKLKRRLWFDERFSVFVEALASRSTAVLVENQPRIWERSCRYILGDSFRSSWAQLALQSLDLSEYAHRWLAVGAGNLSISAVLFRSLNGFDESLQSMEDWDLGARCQKLGTPILFAPEIQSIHQIHCRDGYLESGAHVAFSKLQSKHGDLISAALRDPTPSTNVLRYLNRTPDVGSRLTSCQLGPGTRIRGSFALTFDDGPSSVGTPRILDVLEEFDCKATFFVLASQVSGNRALLQRVVAGGHDVGIHGWYHDSVTSLTFAEAVNMLRRCRDAIEEACGRRAEFARPTYGRASISYLQAATELGLRVVGADVSVQDWTGEDEKELIFQLAKSGFRGKVVLFHDGSGDVRATVLALRWLLLYAKSSSLKVIGLGSRQMRRRLPSPHLRAHDLPGPAVGYASV